METPNIDKPHLIVIEDLRHAYDTHFPVILKNQDLMDKIAIDLEHSLPIASAKGGNLLLDYLNEGDDHRGHEKAYFDAYHWYGGRVVPEYVILSVDLNLGLGATFLPLREELGLDALLDGIILEEDAELLEKYPDMFAGLYLALKAISNDKFKYLLIVVASVAEGVGFVFEALEKKIALHAPLRRKFTRIPPNSWPFVTNPVNHVQKLLQEWQTFLDELQKPHSQLMDDFLRIYCTRGGEGMHPRPKEIDVNVQGYSVFCESTVPDCGFFKAIFLVDPSIQINRENALAPGSRRTFEVSDLFAYLKCFGLDIDTTAAQNEKLKFPIGPGVLFVANLIAFCKSLELHRIRFEIRDGHQRFGFQLNNSKKFLDSLMMHYGNSGKYFQMLRTCSPRILAECDSYEEMKSRYPLQISMLGLPELVDGGWGRRERSLLDVDWDHEHNRLWLSWP